MEHVMDKLERLVRDKIRLADELINAEIGNKTFINAYAGYKSIMQERTNLSWEFVGKRHFKDVAEACNYNMLNDLYIATADFEWEFTAERLAGILRLDEELKRYCKMQVGKGAIFGTLKDYKALARTDLIEAALKLL